MMKFKTVSNKYITIDSARKANWFYHYMTQDEPITRMPFATPPQKKAEQIIERLSFEKVNLKDTTEYIRLMLVIYERTKLWDEDLQWIDKNDKRLIFWLWAYLKYNLHKTLVSYPLDLSNDTLQPDVSKTPAPISDLMNYTFTFNFNASNNQERYEAIIFALEVNKIDGSRKREFLSQLKVQWRHLVKIVPKLTWIIEKPEEADKTLKQLNTMTKSARNNKLFVGLRFDLIRNVGPAELHLGIQAILDYYYIDCQLCTLQNTIQMLDVSQDPIQSSKVKTDAERFLRETVVKLSQKLRKAHDERQKRAREKKVNKPRMQLSAKAQYTAELISLINKQKPLKIIETLLQQELDRLVVYNPSAEAGYKTRTNRIIEKFSGLP